MTSAGSREWKRLCVATRTLERYRRVKIAVLPPAPAESIRCYLVSMLEVTNGDMQRAQRELREWVWRGFCPVGHELIIRAQLSMTAVPEGIQRMICDRCSPSTKLVDAHLVAETNPPANSHAVDSQKLTELIKILS